MFRTFSTLETDWFLTHRTPWAIFPVFSHA